jgi:hypothetical protein
MKIPGKVDLTRLCKDGYAMPKKPRFIHAREAVYLAIEGQGEPGGEMFTQRIGALYGMAYTIKMTRKFAGDQDYVVGKLEALWWADAPEANFSTVPKALWRWKLLIRTPEFVRQGELASAVKVLKKRGKSEPVEAVRLEQLGEGRCVQMLHIGSYDQEGRTVAEMERFAQEQGCAFHGCHHEIYISDPRRVPPEKLKTILRRPVMAI